MTDPDPKSGPAQRKAIECEHHSKSLGNLRASIRSHLLDAGVQTVTAAYEGSNDEGCIKTITLSPEPAIDPGTVMLEFDGGALGLPLLTGTVTYSLIQALQEIFMDLLGLDFAGFEVGSGAKGTLHWDVQVDAIALEHTTFNLTSTSETPEH